MQSIIFQNVVKQFGEFKALDGLSFEVEKGELYGLIGPNGAGKSTAIKIMNGLLKQMSGEVSVLGLSPDDPKARPILGYMPQELALYLDLTVAENMDLFGRLYGVEVGERHRRIKKLLEFVELEKWADSVITSLSGGMQHRASLAVALLSKPRLLILDEPTVGVDPELRASFWAYFAKMQQEGTTILITTHYMDEATRCDRVGLIDHGKLVASGTPAELMAGAGVKNLEDAFLVLTRDRGVKKEEANI